MPVSLDTGWVVGGDDVNGFKLVRELDAERRLILPRGARQVQRLLGGKSRRKITG